MAGIALTGTKAVLAWSGFVSSKGAVASVHTPVDTTSAKGCVGGVAGNVTSPGGHVISDTGDVISATTDLTSHYSYIGHLYQCNIGPNRPT
ncbi:hypothetical protein PCASD_20659 [Puccinia coronata f. sp. avenae]|uniref:Uncharacterized protein n=1 Tax=Puccinia coronata f. sp. avenae TaxID=200324 RepID=A0A2N5TSV6_9BASI|nr:hypothetical protein PCASD_20659 [Puccinia coronata f. sp. avenae]